VNSWWLSRLSCAVILVTGAAGGFGLLSAQALAKVGHTVYASMRATTGQNAPRVAEVGAWAKSQSVEMRLVELDVSPGASVGGRIPTVGSQANLKNIGHLQFHIGESKVDQFCR